jgi:hypothetical protein
MRQVSIVSKTEKTPLNNMKQTMDLQNTEKDNFYPIILLIQNHI